MAVENPFDARLKLLEDAFKVLEAKISALEEKSPKVIEYDLPTGKTTKRAK